MEYHSSSWITHGYRISWTSLNGVQTNWIYAMDTRLHRYRLCCYSDNSMNCLILFNRLLPPFNCHHFTVITVTRLTGYAALLVTLSSYNFVIDTPFVYSIPRSPCDCTLDTVNALRFPTFPFKKSVASLYFLLLLL